MEPATILSFPIGFFKQALNETDPQKTKLSKQQIKTAIPADKDNKQNNRTD